MTWIIWLFVAWVVFNCVAPYAPLLLGDRISAGRIPADLMRRNEAKWVRFYVTRNLKGTAFSVWAPPLWHLVIFERNFFRHAPADLVRFVVAHELGHAAAKHHIWRWLAIVSGAALIPYVQRQLEHQERVADHYATLITGLKKEQFSKYLK